MSEEIPPLTHRGPATVSQTPLGSAADLFAGRSEARSEEPQSRKRKEMEDVIQMEELESIMSEDMDCFDEQPSINQGQQAKPEHSSAKQKQVLNTAESSSKRQRVNLEKNGITNQRPHAGSEKESSLQKNSQRSEQHAVRIKTEPADPADCTTANRGSSKLEEMSSASTSKDVIPFEEDDVSFIEVRKDDLLSVIQSADNWSWNWNYISIPNHNPDMFENDYFSVSTFFFLGFRTTQCRYSSA